MHPHTVACQRIRSHCERMLTHMRLRFTCGRIPVSVALLKIDFPSI